MKTSEVLNLAADLIQERGWGTGNDAMVVEAGPLCLEGGIAAAVGLTSTIISGIYYDVRECPSFVAVTDYLAARPETEWHPWNRDDRQPWAWNDGPGRTAEEVIEVLRAAAVIEAAREEQDAAWETYAEQVTA